jgi:maleate isomerase
VVSGSHEAGYLSQDLTPNPPTTNPPNDPADLNDKMAEYLNKWSFEVGSVVSLGTAFTRSSVASVADIYRAARKAAEEAQNAEAIFIPCTNFPVVDLITAIETDTGLPVIANITSQLYTAFKAIGMREKINGYGKLLRLL